MSSGIKSLLSGPVLFDIFIKGLNNGPEGWIIKSGEMWSWEGGGINVWRDQTLTLEHHGELEMPV